jgi:hypothetical protein
VQISEPFSAQERREYRGIRVPDTLVEAEPDHWQGNIPNFYGIYKCNELKRRYERDHGFRYDLVIRMRPDLRIPQQLPAKVLEERDTLWHTHPNAPIQVSDKLAISNSENMDYYASVWKHLEKYWENPLGSGNWKNHRVGERLLAHHMDQSDISVKKFDINSSILRSRAYIRRKTRQELQFKNKIPSKQQVSTAVKNPYQTVSYLFNKFNR